MSRLESDERSLLSDMTPSQGGIDQYLLVDCLAAAGAGQPPSLILALRAPPKRTAIAGVSFMAAAWHAEPPAI